MPFDAGFYEIIPVFFDGKHHPLRPYTLIPPLPRILAQFVASLLNAMGDEEELGGDRDREVHASVEGDSLRRLA